MSFNLFDLSLSLTTKGDASMKHSLHQIESGVDSLRSKFNLMLGLLAGGEIFEAVIGKSVELAEHLSVLSEKTGETVENLYKLEYAAKLSNVESSTLGAGLRKLATGMQGVNLETGKAVEGFKAMGLTVKNADGTFRSQTDVLLDVAEKFATYKDGAAKSALAMDIFGKAGTDLIPLLNRGKEGIKELTDEAQRLGFVMSKQDQETLSHYEETMKKFHSGMEAAGRVIAVALVPTLTKLANWLAEDHRLINFVNSAMFALQRTVLVIANAFIQLSTVLRTAFKGLQGIWEVTKAIVSGDFVSASAKLTKIGDELQDMWDETETKVWKNRLAMMNLAAEADSTAKKVDETNKKVNNAPTIMGDTKASGSISELLRKLTDEGSKIMKAQLDYQMTLAKDNYEQKKALLVAELDSVSSTYGAESVEYLDYLTQLEKLYQEHMDTMEALEEERDNNRWSAFVDRQEKLKAKAQEYASATASVIEATFKAAFSGKGIGGIFKELGDTVLQALGGMFVRIGTAWLTYGFTMLKFTAALFTPGGGAIAAIGMGTALVALGASLAAIGSGGSGGGGGGGSGSAYGGVAPATSTFFVGPTSASTAAGVTTRPPMNITIIGPNDPTAQRQIQELMRNAEARG